MIGKAVPEAAPAAVTPVGKLVGLDHPIVTPVDGVVVRLVSEYAVPEHTACAEGNVTLGLA